MKNYTVYTITIPGQSEPCYVGITKDLKRREKMKAYFDHIREMDPAARSVIEMILLYPSVHIMWFFRPSNFMYRNGLRFIPRLLSQLGRFLLELKYIQGKQLGKIFPNYNHRCFWFRFWVYFTSP